MVSIDQLEDAKPHQWNEAADAWETCARLWETQTEDFQKLVIDRLDHWQGPAAWAAKIMATAVKAGFHTDDNDLAAWMRKTADILRDFAGKISEAQDDLRQAQADEQQVGGLPPRGAGPAIRVSGVDAALEKADNADHETAEKLRRPARRRRHRRPSRPDEQLSQWEHAS